MGKGEQRQKLEEVFRAAAGLPSETQTTYLDTACRGDPELRNEVEAMLAARGDGGAEAPERDPLIGTRLGPYRIEGLLGRGGMGAVYLAVREDGQFRKHVAIKVIPRVMAAPDAVARFRSERQILANLEHANIARLLDGGTVDGVPYLVMEYVEGVPITEYVSVRALSIPDRLRLMRSVCGAVLYAHQKLVIHRDLKPGNILVTADGTVKLLDFGVAKLLDGAAGDADLTSNMIMTLDYASPEQIQGETVTTASDVYSLGVVLYELLTGERPYHITSPNLHDVERVVCQTDPKKPSALATLPARTRRRLAGDLDNIVLKALHKDEACRYGSAEQLSEDLRRHLQGLPVEARRDTLVYRAGKFARRNRWSIAAGLVVASSLVAGTAIAVEQAREAQGRFDQLREFARTVLVDLHGQLSDIPGTARAREALIAHVDEYLKRVAGQHSGDDAALAREFATTYLRLGEIQGATPEAIRSFEDGGRLLERKRKRSASDPADVLVLARLRERAGTTLTDLNRMPEAVENLQAAASLVAGLKHGEWDAEAELVRATADWRLARVYRIEYRLKEAEEHARQAEEACERMLQRGIRTKELYEILNGARMVSAGVLKRQGHWRESMEMYQKVLADTERLAAEEPSSASLQRELAHTHQIVGDMIPRIPGQEAEIRLHVRSAIAIAERMAELDPWDQTAQSELGQYLSSAAEALTGPEDWAEAVRDLRRALPIFETLLKGEPDSGVFQLYAALVEADLGDRLSQRRPGRESIGWIRRGLADLAKLVERDPRNTTNFLELLKVQRMLVAALARSGEGEESLALAADLIGKAQSLARQTAGGEELERSGADLELPRAYAAMANACRVLGRRGEARKWYRTAMVEWQAMRSAGFVSSVETEAEMEESRKGAEQ